MNKYHILFTIYLISAIIFGTYIVMRPKPVIEQTYPDIAIDMTKELETQKVQVRYKIIKRKVNKWQ